MIEKVKSDEQLVERARRAVAAKARLRWVMLLYAALFLGLCGYLTASAVRKIEDLDQLSLGFVYGVALAIAWMTFGIAGGLCLGKFLSGLQGDFRLQELLVSYHDRLRDLGQLPEEQRGESETSSVDKMQAGSASDVVPSRR